MVSLLPGSSQLLWARIFLCAQAMALLPRLLMPMLICAPGGDGAEPPQVTQTFPTRALWSLSMEPSWPEVRRTAGQGQLREARALTGDNLHLSIRMLAVAYKSHYL